VHESRECRLKALLFAVLQLRKRAKVPHCSHRIPVLPLLLKLAVTNAIDVLPRSSKSVSDKPMKTRKAVALALMGWYLMVPPSVADLPA
jgi:hypothetical protein